MQYNFSDEYFIKIVVDCFGYIYIIGLIHTRKMEQVTITNVRQANAKCGLQTTKEVLKTNAATWFNKMCR
jgi:hypothetical protein